jgi:hypothetical protein
MDTTQQIIHWSVRCCNKSCKKDIEKYGFGYLKDQTFFGEKPLVLCPDCFTKHKDDDFVPFQYAHLPKGVWDPSWKKVVVDKGNVGN